MKPKTIPSQGLIHPADARERRLRQDLRGRLARVLISSTAIREQVRCLARAIVRDARREQATELQLVVVLKGAAAFGSMLAQEIFGCGGPPVRLNFIRASSYGQGTTSSGEVKIEGHLPRIRGQNVLIVEDIVDTGLTLSRLQTYLRRERGAASVRIGVLLNKPDRRLPELRKRLKVDYIGFNIPDLFVVGLGLDCAEQFRELPFVAVVKSSS
jgi:hypoxanthine phosphoribosyltransferase